MARLIAALPLPIALAIGRGLGWIYGSIIRYHRNDARAALERVFPDKSSREIQQIIHRMYANLGMNVIELVRLIALNPDDLLGSYIRIEGQENVDAALAQKKGAIVLTGHIGSWDLLCTITPRIGYPLTVITKKLKQDWINRIWLDIRERYGVRFLPAHNSYRQCLKVLRSNEVIGFILDQNMIDKEGIFVDFFGKPACTSPGLAFMAAQAKCPVIPAFIQRLPDGTHVLRIMPALEPPTDREPETIHQATQQYTRILEDYIREHPADWIWLHRRWRTQPVKADNA
jgi:KDO2-lipid IV(A) lauroyltransferase